MGQHTARWKWKGRRHKGDLMSGLRTGLVVAQWNQWVEEHGGEGVATLVGVKAVAKADALDLLGESRQAFELVDRHV